MPLFDVHAHLTHRDLLPHIEAILARASAAKMGTIVSNGLNPADNEAVLSLASRFPVVKPALGLYPVDAVLKSMRAAGVEYPDQRECWASQEAVDWVKCHADEAFAIGEIGLDGHWVGAEFWDEQEHVFKELIRVATKKDKAIIIHTRKREKRALEILDELRPHRVCWHCFGGKVKLAREIASRGHFFSIPANSRRNEAFTRMLQTLPRDFLLLETDSPYLAPEKDGRNEPSRVRETVAHAAELWGMPQSDVEQQFSMNFERLFGLMP